MAMNPGGLPPFLQSLAMASPSSPFGNNPQMSDFISTLRATSGQTPFMQAPQPPPQADFASKLARGATTGLFDINSVWNASNAGDLEAARASQEMDAGKIELITRLLQQALAMGAQPQAPQGMPPQGVPPQGPPQGMPPMPPQGR
jgi:hypothetical protein